MRNPTAAIRRVDARQLTWAGGAMLAAAAVLPALPGSPGLPCPLRAVTGVPCPFCGLTTSVEATVHFRLGDAIAANPVGILLVAAAIVLLIVRPKWIPVSTALAIPLVALMWAFELQRFGLF